MRNTYAKPWVSQISALHDRHQHRPGIQQFKLSPHLIRSTNSELLAYESRRRLRPYVGIRIAFRVRQRNKTAESWLRLGCAAGVQRLRREGCGVTSRVAQGMAAFVPHFVLWVRRLLCPRDILVEKSGLGDLVHYSEGHPWDTSFAFLCESFSCP